MNAKTTDGRKLWSAAAMFLAALLALMALATTSARADAFGQLESWGTFGEGSGQLYNPRLLGVDPVDGSVYVLDTAGQLVAAAEEFRVQKFSSSGLLEGSVMIERSEVGGVRPNFQGIAVDHAQGVFYLLEYLNKADTSNNKPAATQVLAYSTTPVLGSLVPVTPVAVPSPTGSEALDEPTDLAVDPGNHELVIFATDRSNNKVVQRVSSTGVTGPRLAVPGSTFENEPVDLAVGPNGTSYIVDGNPQQREESKAFELPRNLSSISEVPGFVAAREREEPEPFKAIFQKNSTGFGPQIAVSPDGKMLYWKSIAVPSPELNGQGNFLVRGFSFEDEATTVIYGGAGEGEDCNISVQGAALGTVGNNLVVFDQGPTNLPPETEEPPEYGLKVLTFGPGGSECPAPNAAFKTTVGGTEKSSVEAGTTVTLDATPTELNAATASKLTWRVKGPENFTTPVSGGVMTLNHKFEQAGTYTIRLNVEGSSPEIEETYDFGKSWGAPAKQLTVTSASKPKFKLKVAKTGTAAATGKVTSDVGGISCGATCEAEYEEGAVVTLTAAGEGSEFKGWTGCTSEEAGKCKVTMSAAKEVKAEFATPVKPKFKLKVAKTGTAAATGKVTSDVGGISCGATCEAEYEEGAVVTLTAAGEGSEFKGWTGCTSEEAGKCKVTMSAAKEVSAQFDTVVKPPETCATNAALCPPPPPSGNEGQPQPKPLHCKKGFKKKRVRGKLRCVKVRKHHHKKRSARPFSAEISELASRLIDNAL